MVNGLTYHGIKTMEVIVVYAHADLFTLYTIHTICMLLYIRYVCGYI